MNQMDAMRQWWSLFVPPLDPDELAPLSLRTVLEVTDTDYGFVLLREPGDSEFVIHSIQGLPEVVTLQRVAAEELVCLDDEKGPVLPESLPRRSPLRRALFDVNNRLTEESGTIERRSVSLCIPVHGDSGLAGAIVVGVFGKSLTPKTWDTGLIAGLSTQLDRAFRNAMVHERTCATFHDVIDTFGECIDAKGPHSRGHSRSVSHYASLIGRQMGIPEHDLEALEVAGYLHDIGNFFVPESILQKPDKLTSEEYTAVQQSIPGGADLLATIPGMAEVAMIVRHQAERWDGQGYPDGLHEDEIPLGARILSAASRFTAMLSRRSYRKSLTLVSGAMSAIGDESGKALDPVVVQALFSAMGRAK